jgi:hypothetical protein
MKDYLRMIVSAGEEEGTSLSLVANKAPTSRDTHRKCSRSDLLPTNMITIFASA